MALLLTGSAFAQKPQFKLYGFVRTYAAFDTRESSAGTEDLYFYMPKDQSLDADGNDLNAIPSLRYAALTSRLGLDISGVEVNGYKIGAKFETDFYSGVSGVTGTAQLRLRQVYTTIEKNNHGWKIGQAWTPMAADLPDIFSLESGAPFNPFSRSPQFTFDWKFAKNLTLEASAIWQMQYTSTGPSLTSKEVLGVTTYSYSASASANYIKYGCTPELYLGLHYKKDGNVFKIGGQMLSIKPRNYDYSLITGKAVKKVSDRLNTFTFFEYGQFKCGDVTIKEKVTYANDGSHMNLVGGYGVREINEDGSWSYTASRSLSAWATFQYKPKDSNWVPSLFVGYIKQFGTAEEIESASLCFTKQSAEKINQMYRIQPEILYNLGKFQIGLEYMLTAVQYGKADKHMLAAENLHWIANNRIQMMFKFNF